MQGTVIHKKKDEEEEKKEEKKEKEDGKEEEEKKEEEKEEDGYNTVTQSQEQTKTQSDIIGSQITRHKAINHDRQTHTPLQEEAGLGRHSPRRLMKMSL